MLTMREMLTSIDIIVRRPVQGMTTTMYENPTTSNGTFKSRNFLSFVFANEILNPEFTSTTPIHPNQTMSQTEDPHTGSRLEDFAERGTTIPNDAGIMR